MMKPLMLIMDSKVQLREGQREWIWKQMGRLQRIYEVRPR